MIYLYALPKSCAYLFLKLVGNLFSTDNVNIIIFIFDVYYYHLYLLSL